MQPSSKRSLILSWRILPLNDITASATDVLIEDAVIYGFNLRFIFVPS